MRGVDAAVWLRNMAGLVLDHSKTPSIHKQVPTNHLLNIRPQNDKQPRTIIRRLTKANLILKQLKRKTTDSITWMSRDWSPQVQKSRPNKDNAENVVTDRSP